jgi:hypothetical protein
MVRKHQTSDAQLRIGESRDSGFDASHRPGMTGDFEHLDDDGAISPRKRGEVIRVRISKPFHFGRHIAYYGL